MNTNQVHFNRAFAERTEFGRPLVVSSLTLALVLGLSVADTSENALANLEWTNVKLPHPVFVGDTLWAESEILSTRESKSRQNAGIIGVRTRGINQEARVVIEFVRAFMVYKRDAPETTGLFPVTGQDWSV
jgi:acyl dehydratase